jgi:CheY-like chemotaxis protein
MIPPQVLLVDDAADVAFIVGRLARRAGHAITVCSSAEAALDWFKALRPAEAGGPSLPDLVLVDVHLPGASGIALCRELRTLAALDGLPLALFSDWHRIDEIADGLAAGATHVVCKDVLCDPVGWQTRIAEILPPPYGFRPEWMVQRSDLHLHVFERGGVNRFNRDLVRFAGLPMGPRVLRVLLARAVAVTVARHADALPQRPAEDRHDGLLSGGPGLDASRIPADVAGFMTDLTFALAEQVWCALGGMARTPIEAFLGAGSNDVPGGSLPGS